VLGVIPLMTGSALKLEVAFKAKFGEAAWNQMQGKVRTTGPFGPTADVDALLAKVRVTVDGDKAEAEVEGEAEKLKLAKKDGVWKIDPGVMMKGGPPPEQADMAVKLLESMAKALQAGTAEVNRPGSTVESVQKKIDEEIAKVMRGLMPPPE